MIFSKYFNLNKAEATDKFNELTINNPAIDKIDEQMYKNQNAAVQSAEHSKSGTVHALVKSINTATVLKFTATADFTVGDTFTLDGQPISARMTDGSALQSNAFRTGNNVICVQGSGVLTFFVAGKDWTSNITAITSSINELTRATTVEKISLTAEPGFVFTGECFRAGRVVTINGAITGNFGAQFNNQALIDLPLKYCPTKDFGAPATLYGAGYVFGSGFVNVRKRSNGLSGAIGIVSNTPNCSAAYVSATWLLEELPA